MDDVTLEGLKAAFKMAPSSELARIVVLALIDRGDHITAVEYIEYLDSSMSFDDFSTIARVLLEREDKNLLSSFLRKLQSPDIARLIEDLIAKGKREEARNLYTCSVAIDASFENDHLEKILDEKPSRENKQPKLHVVEKVDFREVTDLTRYLEASTTFADVVGLDDIKKQINKKIILPFQKPSLFQRFKKKIGGGVLLFGPPGCGKTLLARATAGECNASFFNIEISDVLDMYIGESEQKLHAIFEKARGSTPSVLFFDELEALAGKREHTRNSATSNVVSQFLTELDGFSQNNSGVLVLASTNVPWSIDPAFLRPGRFDRMFFVPPPDKTARASILQHHMQGRPSQNNIDYSNLAAKSGGYSGADLANLVEMAADEAIDDSIAGNEEVKIEQSHFNVALKESRPTTTEWLTTARNYARYANDGGRYNDVLEFLKKHGK